jgi:hypothetical protein
LQLNGKTPLHYAAQSENVALVEALLAKGADKDAKDCVRRRPKTAQPETFARELIARAEALYFVFLGARVLPVHSRVCGLDSYWGIVCRHFLGVTTEV